MSNEEKLTWKECLDICIAFFGVSAISAVGFMSIYIVLR